MDFSLYIQPRRFVGSSIHLEVQLQRQSGKRIISDVLEVAKDLATSIKDRRLGLMTDLLFLRI